MAKPKQECPLCKKEFVRLDKHKCSIKPLAKTSIILRDGLFIDKDEGFERINLNLIREKDSRDNLHIIYLKNGLKVIYYKRPSKSIFVSICFRAGLISESLEKVGISHFLEHVLFNSTKNHSREEIAQRIENLGGVINGSTYEFGTNYYIKIDSQYFPVACETLSDMMLNPLFNERELELERNVIFNEIKNEEDNEASLIFKIIRETLFPNEIYQYSPAGTIESVKNISKSDLIEYYTKFYTVENAFLIIIGDLEENKIISVLENYFDKLPIGSEKIELPYIKYLPLEKTISLSKTKKELAQAHLMISYNTTYYNDRDQNALRIISNLLDRGLSGRMIKAIRTDKGLAYSVSVINLNTTFLGRFIIYIVSDKKTIEKCKKIALRVIEDLRKDPITEDELRNAKSSILGRKVLSYERSESIFLNIFLAEIFRDLSLFSDYEFNLSQIEMHKISKTIELYFGNYIEVTLR